MKRYLDCGLYENGFARVRCPACHEEYLLAFSCKTRELCPSCAARRAAATAVLLREEVLEEVGLLTEERIELLLSWRHTGFSVHNRVRVEPEDGPAVERLARYIMRPPMILLRGTRAQNRTRLTHRDRYRNRYRYRKLESAPMPSIAIATPTAIAIIGLR